MTASHEFVRFVPSQVSGLADVREVVVRPEQLEVYTAEGCTVFRFSEIARPREHTLVTGVRRVLGLRRRGSMVGERDWCRSPRDRYFEWYTDPPLRTCMPETESAGYGGSLFPRIHMVLAEGGFATFDLA